MSIDKTHICLSCNSCFFDEQEMYACHKCSEYICPDCGGEIMTIEEYDRNERENYD
jgi:hypothetical protein